jgi:broad specificity phosphatase PhoE
VSKVGSGGPTDTRGAMTGSEAVPTGLRLERPVGSAPVATGPTVSPLPAPAGTDRPADTAPVAGIPAAATSTSTASNEAPDTAVAAWTGQVGEPTRLVLLRHGQTELSVQRRYSGHGDPELTSLGHAQAAAAAARLAELPDVEAVLSSPLRRARQTAAAVAEATGAPLLTRDRLIETDFGGWEGLTFTEARERDPELHASWLGSEEVSPPGGESFAEVGRRIEAELDEVLVEYPGTTVVVVSHVTPIKTMLRLALQGGPGILYRLHLDLASISIVDLYPDGGASVRLVNDVSHNPALG